MDKKIMRKPIVVSNEELFKKICDMGFADQLIRSVPDKDDSNKQVHFFKYVGDLWVVVKEYKAEHGRA